MSTHRSTVTPEVGLFQQPHRLLAIGVLLLALCAGAAHAVPPTPFPRPHHPPAPRISESTIRVVVNGATVTFDVQPVLAEGTVYVPMRGVFERVGATVNFDRRSGQVTATRAPTTVELKVGVRLARVNGENMVMLAPALYKKGRTLVPLRFVTEALGAEVTWNPVRREVNITAQSARKAKIGGSYGR